MHTDWRISTVSFNILSKMKMNTVTRILSCIALAWAMIVSAQQTTAAQDYVTTPVSISKEKVRVNGKICYSHIVLEKQTLFSIAKAYDVTVADIYRFNPSLQETGLKKNSIILIPSKEALASDEPAKSIDSNKQEVKHQEVNDDVQIQKTVKEDKQVDRKKEDKQKISDRKKPKTHIRKWYEDLDVIAERYGVSVEAIMKANNLTGRKLQNRQKLIIPDGEYFEEAGVEHDAENSQVKESASQADTLSSGSLMPEWLFTPQKDVTMTLILPLKAGDEKSSRNNMDFYSGVLLAVKDLAEEGISTFLNVYDSSDETHPVTIEDIESSDIVLGPVSSGDIRRLVESIPSDKIVVSPLDQRAEPLTSTYINIVQAPTPHRAQYSDLMAWIREDMQEGDKVFIISEKGARVTDAINQMNAAIEASGLTYLPYTYNILEGRDVIEPLTAMMTADAANRVFIASESEAFVNDVVRNLNILVYNKLDIVLYAPSKIRSFDTIEVENLHNVASHVSLAYYIDYENPEVQDFIMKYRALFNTEPSQFAFQGYDAADYFITLCSRYGKRWEKKLDNARQSMMQSTFDFQKKEEGGFVNQGVRRIVYGEKWSVSQL